MMQLTNKRASKIHAFYKLEGTVLENVESIKYLGVTITKDLKWNTHISNVCTKANRTLVFFFFRRNLFSCPKDVRKKEQVGNDQEKAQSEKDSHSKTQGGKKKKLTIRYLYHETYRKPNEQLFSQ